jgi:tetratricopeptide (TPR) repeat protein
LEEAEGLMASRHSGSWWVLALALAATRGVAAETYTADQLALYSNCEQNPPVVQIQACSMAIDSHAFQGTQLAGLHVNRANAYDANGDKDKALKDYNRALELAPGNAGIYYNRGVLFVAQQDYKAALADYSEAIRLAPTAVFYQKRGSVYVMQHDFQRALEDESNAIRLDASMALAYFFRSMAYGGLGAGEKASADVETAIRLDPNLAQFVKLNGKSPSFAPPQ